MDSDFCYGFLCVFIVFIIMFFCFCFVSNSDIGEKETQKMRIEAVAHNQAKFILNNGEVQFQWNGETNE